MATTIVPQIVTVNVTVQEAPEPNQYQQSGAIVSVGGTTLTVGDYAYCGNLVALTALLGTAGNYAELTNMATTFFAQGNAVGLYVLELGTQTSPTPSALGTWDAANPGVFYAYLVPADWDGAAMATVANSYSSPDAKKYFFVTTTSTTYTDYASNKAVFAFANAPSMGSSEFDAASAFYNFLMNNPSATNQLQPMGYRFLYGTTPWPLSGQSSAIQTLLTGNVNISFPNNQAGLTSAGLYRGSTMDGEQAAWWYGVDWTNINVNQAIANAVINGANGQPPLVFNQAGVNSLLEVAQSVADQAVQFGCVLSATVSAVPFYTYVNQNPANYKAGLYSGLSMSVVGLDQFLNVVFNLNATQFG